MPILCVKVIFQGLCKKNFVNFHYILESQKQLFSRTCFQWLFPKTIMLVILQKQKQIFPLHALLVPKTKISGRTKEGNQFLDWQINLAYAYSSTDSRLNMLISVKLIKEHVTIVQFLYILYYSKKKQKKTNKLEVTFFDGNIYLYKETRSFDEFYVKETSSNASHFLQINRTWQTLKTRARNLSFLR